MYSVLLKTHINRGNSGRKIVLFIKDALIESKKYSSCEIQRGIKGPVIIYWGGGEGLGQNNGNLADPLITFDDFREIPTTHVFIFQANLSGPPSESIKSFQRSPLWVLSYDRLPPPPPPFVLLKIKWSPTSKKKKSSALV